MSAVILGFWLFIIGAGLTLVVLVSLRFIPRLQNLAQPDPQPPASPQLPSHGEAVLLIQQGGRVAYMNQTAREWFNLWEDEPNLERLARRARPSEAFLSLCAGEGQARLSLNGRSAEATSYFAPGPANRCMLVSLRRPQLLSVPSTAGPEPTASPIPQVDSSSQALSLLNELNQAMTASLDLEQTLQAILEGVERLIPSEISEITLMEGKAGENSQGQLVPYRYMGTTGVDRHLEKAADRYRLGEGYSGYLISQQAPLLIGDVAEFRPARPNYDRSRLPIQAYLGVPLTVASEVIGTLELASLGKEAFSENDLEVLRLLSGQAAVAVHNAIMYRDQQRRALELAGLANLAQAVGELRDPQDLFARLVESVAPLLNVEILGFLVYDENRRVLSGQNPFLGIQPSVVDWYQTSIPPETKAEALWLSQEPIVSTNAAQDERLILLGLNDLATVASITHTVLMPLASGGRMLGYLQAAKKVDGLPFGPDDLRLLAIIAGQAAPIIENVGLVTQSRRRAQRADTLRRIASLTNSTATLDEILNYSLLDLARLLQADMAAIYMVDEHRGEMRLHKASLFGVPPEITTRLGRISTDDPQFQETVAGSLRSFITGDLEADEQVGAVYRTFSELLKIKSVLDVPLKVRERGTGEMILASFRPDFFTKADEMTAVTAASQLASAIEQSSLYHTTDESLRQRVDQLTALTRISRELNSTLDLQYLIQRVFDEVVRTTHADCGTILLFEINETMGVAPRIMLYLGDEPGPKLHLVEKQVLEVGEAVIIDDFDSPFPLMGESGIVKEMVTIAPTHPGIRSALVVPIAYLGQVAGLIHLHSRAAGRFNATSREIAETLAIQAAIALGNAHRYREQVSRSELLSRRVETLSKLFETSLALQADQPLDEALEAIAYAIQAASPFEVVLISVYDPQDQALHRTAAAGIPLATLAELRQHPTPWKSARTLMTEDYQFGQCYFLPEERRPVTPPEMHTITLLPGPVDLPENVDPSLQWKPKDMLLLPLMDADGQPLGLVSVDVPRNNRRPDRATLETIEIFGSQAALAIESQLKVQGLRGQLTNLTAELKQAQEAAESLKAESSQNRLPSLLHKDLEQTLTIQRLNQRSRRIRGGLEMAETINRQPDRPAVLRAFAQQLLIQMEFEIVLVAERRSQTGQPGSAGELTLVETLGALPAGANPEALLGQRNPLRYSLQNSTPLLVANLDETAEWQNSPLLNVLEAKAFASLPILNEGQVDSILLAISHTVQAPFTTPDEQLFSLLTRQAGVALQNLRALADTRRRLREVNLLLEFSHQLGSLDSSSVLNSLVESALHVVPAAGAAMVVLWDELRGALVPQAAQGFVDLPRLMQMTFKPGEALAGQVFQQAASLRLDEVNFSKHYNLSPENLRLFRDATGGRLPVSAMAIPILATTGVTETHPAPLGVLMLSSSNSTAAFTDEDQALITSLVQQTALTLENARLYQASEERALQMQTLARLATAINSSLESDELIDALLDQLQVILPYETGTLWLRQRPVDNPRGGRLGQQMLVVRAARGFEDSDQRVGLTVALEDSALLAEMIQTGQPISVGDIRKDPRFSSLAVQMLLEMAGEIGDDTIQLGKQRLSWLGVPLIASGEVTGVIALEKSEANFYTSDHVQVANTFASQAAVGIENARLYQESVQRAHELAERSQRLDMLNRLSSELSGSLDISHILGFTTQVLSQVIDCNAVTAVLFDDQSRAKVQAEYPGFGYPLGDALPACTLFERLGETLGIFSTEDVGVEPELEPLQDFLRRYHTRSLLALPIVTGGSDERSLVEHYLHGLLLVHNEQAHRYEPEEVELARTISNQVAIAVQNARLFDQTRSLTSELEQRVEARTAELYQEHRRAETLLRIITELSASLDLDQVLHRTLEVLNEVLDAEQITVLIARLGERQLQGLATVSGLTNQADNPALEEIINNLQQVMGTWIVTYRQSAIIGNLAQDEKWNYLLDAEGWPEGQSLSVLGVPLMSGAEALGALLLLHRNIDHFSSDQEELAQAAANQVAVAVNNAELYRLIRDQAEDLGSMLRNQQVENSRSKAILEAVADGVLVTDDSNTITLFNASAENNLGLSRNQVLGKSLEYFTGLFGSAAKEWMETISAWTRDPNSSQLGEMYAQEITLEDGRVLSVHLAPVILRNDFLGTVSIFTDITHQVEVDRLKSEFVATVSHELRTPMTSIKGYVEILLMGAAGQINEQQTRFLQVVKANTERLAVLVNDLLDISRIEAGRLTLSLQPLSLDELVAEMLDELEHRIRDDQSSIRVERDFQPGLPRVHGDSERVRTILDNLLDNAYLYNTPDGCITVRLHQAGAEIQVDVIDTGMGIPPEDQQRVFERFYRGENPLVLGVGGTGLGLSITQNLVEMHHGRIWLESQGVPGQGSIFSFTLPVYNLPEE